MSWDGYTVLSVVAGAMLITMAAWPLPIGWGNRVALALVGGASIAYGLYVAHQPSGTYYFDVRVFVLPPVLLLYGIGYLVWNRRRDDDEVAPTEQAPARTAAERAIARRTSAPRPDPVARQAEVLRGTLTASERAALRAGTSVSVGGGRELTPDGGSVRRPATRPSSRRASSAETAADRAVARRARLRDHG